MEKAQAKACAGASNRLARLALLRRRAAIAAMIVVGAALGLVFGWMSAKSALNAPDRSSADPVDMYRLDSPGNSRDVSIPGSYLDLLSEPDVEAR